MMAQSFSHGRVRIPDVREATPLDKARALESEAALLRPYASTEGLKLLKARLRECEEAARRLRGLEL